MAIELRPYQGNVVTETYKQWDKFQDVLAVLPTGGGKTVILSYIVQQFAARNKRVLVKVHRKELIGQISVALGRMGVVHTFIAAKSTIKFVTDLHQREFGKSFYSTTANICVASVDTIVNRNTSMWDSSVALQIDDECHHVLKDNKWGKVHERFENAHSLGVTATPQRADGYGLGRSFDGVYDYMVLGPTMRQLITMGNLCEYKVFVPPTVIDFGALKTGATGDYTANSVDDAMKNFKCGNVVDQYLKIAPGKRTITFARSVKACEEQAEAFRAKGVPAVAVSAKNTNEERAKALRDFADGKILQMINCDIFAEGYDCPAVEFVQDASPSKSLAKFHQRFGRMLRPNNGKLFGGYIDHVGNIKTEARGNHALPDSPMLWSLDRRKKRDKEADDNIMKLTGCLNLDCMQPYPSELDSCPHCGTPKPASTGQPQSELTEIDDNLVELTPATLAQLRGEIEHVRQDSNEAMVDRFGPHATGVIPYKWRKDHKQRKEALNALDTVISWWCGMMREYGFDDETIRNTFGKEHGMSIYHARTLKRADAQKLIDKINPLLVANGIDVL